MSMIPNSMAGEFAELGEVLLTLLLSNSFSFLIGVAAYILTALSLYTIARRRGISNPWLAWLPVANLWVLGSISDQYQYVAQGLVRNRRKILLGLSIAFAILWIGMVVSAGSAIIGIIAEIPTLENALVNGMDEAAGMHMLETFLPPLLGLLGISFVMSVVAVVQTVFEYICYYNLFASCQPDNKVLYILLSIFIHITLPVFLMICRDKDLGMPPRKPQPTPTPIPEDF